MTGKSKEAGQPKKPGKPEYDDDIDNLLYVIRNLSNAQIFHNSFLSRGTIAKLRHPDLRKRTRKPQHMTMRGTAAAAGFEYRLVRRRKP